MDVRLAKTKKELLDHLYIRGQVFIIEQAIDYAIEFEGDDYLCDLFVSYIDGVPVGAARLKDNKVGRVATLSSYRYHGVGRALMNFVEAYAKDKGIKELKLHAQKPVEEFYQKLGYVTKGDIFYEADIPHVLMTKTLN
jgi:predicted GNAT family N-acyltransferase